MKVRQKLAQEANSVWFICFATIASFLTYTAMYAVRKAFAAGTYGGQTFWGIDFKIWLVTAQTIGYTLSKWIGIKIVAENTPKQRPRLIIGLILISVLSLGLFAIVSSPYNIAALFLNGLPIGMIFGLIFNYLEGRRSTEILVVGLTITQIFSSGFVKSMGQYFIHNLGVNDIWMPFIIGLCFLPVLLFSVWMLEQLPPQTKEDIALKSARSPMIKVERKQFIRHFIGGLTIFMISYILMTSYRDFRDNFAPEIWQGLGFEGHSSIFTLSEIPVSIIILFLMIFLQKIQNNLKAFLFIHAISITGALILLISTLCYGFGYLSPQLWICATGIGLYIAYVPANTIFFERMLAVFKHAGNAGFIVIMADFYGYCGSISVLFYKNFGSQKMSYVDFFFNASLVVAGLLLLAQVSSVFYFLRKVNPRRIPAEKESQKLSISK
ncbi:hypothetical protein DBR32_15025 [Taibaiella sp. KBW10]|uniref:DUF5690 family protein n=1 Tax=Taibaiella sp. KBW10 TaxID=2153357 RepID=UPI000F591154|nr:DUF5690 family protein [Taibaiella sp. KBW10]RQO29886.1 hypothetical protein DBR32_15025 [Taibaiella sp. KBW10]